MQKVIKILKQTPQTYIQLFLLNLALTIILIKEIQITYAIISFAFCFLITSALHYRAFKSTQAEGDKEMIQIIHQDIKSKFNDLKHSFSHSVENTQTKQAEKKTNYTIAVMIVVYVSINFLCAWMQSYLLMNVTYIHFFIPEISQFMKEKCSSLCNGQCPFAKQK